MKKLGVLMSMMFFLLAISFSFSFAGDRDCQWNSSDCDEGSGFSDKKPNVQSDRPFIEALPGSVGSFLVPGIPLKSGEWQMHCPPVYKKTLVKEAKSAERGFRFSDIFPWNWGGNVHSANMAGKSNVLPDEVVCTDYWPKDFACPGDKVLGVAKILGEPNEPDELYFGQAVVKCAKEYGSSRVAIHARKHIDGVTVGNSLGLGGAAAKITGGVDESVAFAVGGQLGKNRTRVEDYIEFEILCMNDGPTEWKACAPPVIEKPKALSVVEKPKPTEPKKPDACEEVQERIQNFEQEIKGCKQFCYNNFGFRSELADANIDKFSCASDKQYLYEAIKQYKSAENNYRYGHDIRDHQAEADKLIAQVYYNWAGCIYELYGREEALKFAKEKHLERIPTGFVR